MAQVRQTKDSAKLDAQEQAMQILAQKLKETKAIMAEPSREVRRWRMLFGNWKRGITTIDAKERARLEDSYQRQKRAVDRFNSIAEAIQAPKDGLGRWQAVQNQGQELADAFRTIPDGIKSQRTVQQIVKYLQDLDAWHTDWQDYHAKQTAWEDYQARYQAYERAKANWEDEKHAQQIRHDAQLARYEDAMKPYLESKRDMKQMRADLKEVTGKSLPKLAVEAYTSNLAQLVNGTAVTDDEACLEYVQAILADIPDGLYYEDRSPSSELGWIDNQTADMVDRYLGDGDWGRASQALQARLLKAVDRACDDLNEIMEPLRHQVPRPDIEKPKAIEMPPYPKAPEKVGKPREIRSFSSIKIQPVSQPKPPKELTQETADKGTVDRLAELAKGKYINTIEHAQEIDALAQRVGAPVLGLEVTSLREASRQTGLKSAIDAVVASQQAFGSQRHSDIGSRLIKRLSGALEGLQGVSDLHGLKTQERRFLSIQQEIMSWVNSRWIERGGTPVNDANARRIKRTSWD